jgi:hypothetical protein
MSTTIKSAFMQPKLRLLLVTVSVILFSFVTTSVFGQVTVSTDKNDYPPGATVLITGSGFIPGETVTLQVTHVGEGDNSTSAAHAPWDVVADVDGNINSTWLVPQDEDELGATLLLTADGQSSGLHATTTFTDAAAINLTSNPVATSGSLTICAGTSVTFTASFACTPGAVATYAWKIGGVTQVTHTVNTISDSWTTSGLTSGNVVTCTITFTNSGPCNGSPVTTSAITVTVTSSAPSITTQPVDKATCDGTNASFSVVVSGTSLGYQWQDNSSGSFANISGATSPTLNLSTVTGAMNGRQYKCIITNTCGSVTSNTVTLNINPLPQGSISGNSICSGGQPQLTFTASSATGSFSIFYQAGSSNSNNFTAGGVVSGVPFDAASANNGNYILKSVTDANGCVRTTGFTGGSATVTTTANVTPSVTIAITSGSNPICSGSTVTFTATPTNGGTPTYQWKKDGADVGTNSPTYTDDGTVAGSITCVMTSTLTCVTSATATSNAISLGITARLTPSVSIAVTNGSNSTCPGTSVTFTATPSNGGTPTYQWKKDGVNVGTNSPAYTDAGTTSGNISVVMTSSIICVTSSTATSNEIALSVNPLPALFTVTGGGAYCSGGSGVVVGLSGSETGVNYQLKNGASNVGSPIAGTGSAISFGNQATVATYTVIATNATTSCIRTMSGNVAVTVSPLPNDVSNSFAGSTICNGDAGILSFDAIDASFVAPYTIQYTDGTTTWSQTISSASPTSFNVAVSPTVTTNYSLVSITNGNGCTITSGFTDATAQITVRATPTASISGTTTVCQNGSSPNITFTNPQSSAVTITYNINGGSNLTINVATNSSANVAAPTGAAGVFNYNLVSVNYQTAPNCANNILGTAQITVRATPTASISGTTTVCQNGSSPNITFTNPQNLAERITYNINGGTNTTVDVAANSLSTVAAATGTAGTFNYNLVSVVYPDGSPSCSNNISGTATVTVRAPATATIGINGSNPICSGSTTSIKFTGPSNGIVTYNTNGGAGISASLNNGGNFILTSAALTSNTTYNLVSVAYGDNPGCSTSASGSVTVTVNQPPSINIQPINQTVTYGDASASFSVDATGTPAPTYQWYVNTGSGFTLMPGETSTSLSIVNPIVAMNGYLYHVVITNICSNIISNDVSLTVGPKAATVSANAKSKTYGDDNPTLDATVNGTVNGDVLNYTLATTALKYSGVGDYPITVTLGSNANYSVTPTDGNLHIGPKAATVSANAKSKTYGDAVIFTGNEFTTLGFVNTDAVTSVTLTSTGAAATATVAGSTYPIVASAAVGTGLGNYTISYVDGALTVKKRLITITADAKAKTFGDVDPGLTYQITYGSLVNGDLFTGNLTRDAGENVGPYAIRQGIVALNGNYTLSYIGANLVIGQKPVPVTVNTGQNKTYGALDPVLTYTSNPAVGSTLPNGILVSFTGALARVVGENVGPYAINQGTLANANYNISFTGADFAINPLPVTVKAGAGQNKMYGNTDPSPFTFTSTPAVGSSLPNGVTISFTGALTRVSGENVGAYALQQGSLDNTNYAITFVPYNFTINKRPITINVTPGQTKVFGNTDPLPFTYTVAGSGLAGWDQFTGALDRASGADVGIYPINQGTLTIQNSATLVSDVGNYTVIFNPANFTITIAKTEIPVVTFTPSPVQYSDSICFKATITSATAQAQLNNTGGTVEFKLKSYGGVTTSLGSSVYPADWNSTYGTVTKKFKILVAPGTYTVIAVFTPSDTSNFSSSTNVNCGSLIVNQDDATIDYTGDQLVSTGSTSNSTVTVTLRANISDINVTSPGTDASPGDIRNAKVKFIVTLNGLPVTISNPGWISVDSLIIPGDARIGMAKTNFSASLASASDAEYDVRVLVGFDGTTTSGYYVAEEEKSVITVYKPTGDFITGGGYIVNAMPEGLMKADVGSKTNFGFNVKLNKTGKNLQGNLNFVFRRKVGTAVKTYQVKTNAMESLSVNASNVNRQTANFVSKCNITDITNPLTPVAIGGNKFMYVNMIDNGEPGTKDSISFVLIDGSGDPTILANIMYTSHWEGNLTRMKKLGGGNLVVHSGFNLGSSNTIAASANPRIADNATTAPVNAIAFDVKAYPNPTSSQFNVKLESSNTIDPISIIVYGVNGKVIEQKQKLSPGQIVQLGALYRPGLYILEMIQGHQHRQLKLVKIPD